MSFEIDDFDANNAVQLLTSWALETGLWKGRAISFHQASDFHKEVQARLTEVLFKDEESFEKLARPFAWIGSTDRTLLAKDIQALDFSNKDLLLQVGFCQSAHKFWKKHKKEILIGASLVVALTVVVVIAVSATAAAGVAAAAGGALDSLDDPALAEKKKPEPPKEMAPELSRVESALVFNEAGVVLNGEGVTYREIVSSSVPLAPAPAAKSWMAHFLEMMGRGLIDPDLQNPHIPLPSAQQSHTFITDAIKAPHRAIGGINGMNTSLEESLSHSNYLTTLSPNHSIEWVYNCSHGPLVDIAEIFTCNYEGYSPKTADLLQQNWRNFDKVNENRPDAKYLQFCHSQGAIHVRNALAETPAELRKRVIVVAIAPGAVVDRNLCYNSYNYACKSDIVPLGELAFTAAIDPNECGISKSVERAMELQKQLILLDLHPESKSPHDFQGVSFKSIISGHIQEYINKDGEYK